MEYHTKSLITFFLGLGVLMFIVQTFSTKTTLVDSKKPIDDNQDQSFYPIWMKRSFKKALGV